MPAKPTLNRVRTPTVYCDGSSDFESVDKGKYYVDISVQIIAILTIVLIGLNYFLKFPKKKVQFLSKRFDLFKIPLLEKIVRYKYFSFALRLIPALILILVFATGFWGRTRMSFAAPFVWVFWWTLLIFFVAFAGKIFCAICPWDFFANLFQYGIVFNKKNKKMVKLKKWPNYLKNVYPAVIFFIVFTWLELGGEITKNSYLTALFGLFILMLAILIPVIYEKRAFCRYLCPVGRISGLYAIFSPVELRVKSLSACDSCKTKDCVKGNEYSTACPMELIPFKLKENTYCTLCTECIRSCDKKNLTLKLRPFGSEINTIKPKSRNDEAVLAITIFGLTFFHGITMINPWFVMIDELRNYFNISYLYSFSILMSCFIILYFLSYQGLNKLIGFFCKNRIKFSDIAITLIPITLAYHLGHNVMHVFGELPFFIPTVNDPFGWGWDLFGLKSFTPKPFLFHDDMIEAQVVLVVIGFYYSIKTLRIKLNLLKDQMKYEILEFQLIYFIGFILLAFIAVSSFWLIGQPMVVRGGI